MFYDNLKAECEKQGVKLTPIVLECGGTKGIIGGWKNGAAPRSDIVMKLAVRLNVPTDYLLFGEIHNTKLSNAEKELINLFKSLSDEDKGRVLGKAETLAEIAAQKAAAEAAKSIRVSINASDGEPVTTAISIFDLPASAGTGVFLSDSNAEPLDVLATPEAERANFALRVSGDSMSPTFRNKDIVLVESAKDINIGEIGIFIADGEGYIKERGEDALISHNHAYEPLSFSDFEYVKCIGRVLGKAKLTNSR